MVYKFFGLSLLALIFSIMFLNLIFKFKTKHRQIGLNVQEIIEEYGYPSEMHNVITEDGYILTLHRIPHGKENFSSNRKPILLVPGIFQSAWDFVHYGPNNSLSFILTEEGYDVWLGNVRGTTWSRKHKILDPDKDTAFWDYTLNELGIYDLPAFIDYILQTTEQKSLYYVGYSQGTIALFIMGSEKSNYLSKIKFMSALSPAIFLKNVKSPILKFMANNWKILQVLLDLLNYQEMFKRGDIFTTYLEFICGDENSLFIHLCIYHLFSFFGYDSDELNKTMLPLTISQTPCGASQKQIGHVAQMIQSGDFQQFDFGTEENLKRYDQERPPFYNVSKVTTPVALYYAGNDWAVDETNIDRIMEFVPNVVKRYKVPWENFNHIDFVYAKNVAKLLYNAVVEELSKH